MQTVFSLHELLNPVSWENKKTIPKCRRLKSLPRVLRVKIKTEVQIDRLQSPVIKLFFILIILFDNPLVISHYSHAIILLLF